MKKTQLATLLAVLVLSGCHDHKGDDSVDLTPLDPSTPVQPPVEPPVTPPTTPCEDGSCLNDDGYLTPVLPSIPLEPANAAATNLVYYATSSYPRSMLIGMVSSNANDGNDVFHLYSHDKMPTGDSEQTLAENVVYKGRLKINVEPENRMSGEIPEPNDDEQEMIQISNHVMALDADQQVNIYMEESFIRRSAKMMTPEALQRTKSITIAIEGSGSITDTDRLQNVIDLAKVAKENGVEKFNVSMFSSVDLDVLAEQRPQWDEMINNDYITILPVNFDKLRDGIEDGYETEVFGNIVKFMGYDLSTAFTKSEHYDETKKLLVYFGSARNGYGNTAENKMGGNYNNMLMIDKYLADPEISSEYNIAIKPHPKLDWITRIYIPNYAPEASHFSRIPFEVLVLAGGKDFGGKFSIPVIDRVDSTYSTIMFAVEKEKIHSVIDYSPYEGFNDYNGDTVEYMRENYVLLDGWGFDGDTDHDGIKDADSYKDLAEKFTKQINAPHIKVTNVYEFVNN